LRTNQAFTIAELSGSAQHSKQLLGAMAREKKADHDAQNYIEVISIPGQEFSHVTFLFDDNARVRPE
jgi:hypothetical protein